MQIKIKFMFIGVGRELSGGRHLFHFVSSVFQNGAPANPSCRCCGRVVEINLVLYRILDCCKDNLADPVYYMVLLVLSVYLYFGMVSRERMRE